MARRKAVGFVAPSGFVPDGSAIDRAAQVFAARGWQPVASDTCFEKHQRFAGDDDLRAAELQRFGTDRAFDLVLSARGGYGLTRVLPRLDFEAIRRADRIFCGYSDFTAFSLAYLAQAEGVSLQGPSATDFGAPTPFAPTVDEFFEVVGGGAHRTDFSAAGPNLDVEGTLWGGNLALVCALLGTPYFPRIRGGILFLEDVNEPAYKIERMLVQLAQAGVLHKQRAILLGRFDPITPMPNDNGYTLAAVVQFVDNLVRTPIVSGLPFGHVAHKLTLPVGVRAQLRLAEGQASLSWPRWR